jgi:hypothetical protein
MFAVKTFQGSAVDFGSAEILLENSTVNTLERLLG